MADRTISLRFYIARKFDSNPPFQWPTSPVIRTMLHQQLPAVNANGISVVYDKEPYLVETSAYEASKALHIQISRDLDEVPAVRQQLKTGPMVMAAGQVPASVSHLTFLPGGVVVIVRGVTSPGPYQSAGILSQATGIPFILQPLTRSDQLQALNNSTGASTVEFTAMVVDRAVADGDSVLQATRALTGQQDFEVTLKLTARGRGGKVGLRRLARKLIDGQISDDIRLKRGLAKLTGPSPEDARTVDLIEDQIAEKRIVTLKAPAGQQLVTLSADDVLREVRVSYNKLLTVVGSALATSPSDFPG